jgi:hypothetical protein
MIIHTKVPKSKKKNTVKTKPLQESWEKLMSKYNVDPKARLKKLKGYSLEIPRKTVQHPSLDSGLAVATKPEIKEYTGDTMIGIAQMHKSNAIPVFSQAQAESVSKMRRN